MQSEREKPNGRRFLEVFSIGSRALVAYKGPPHRTSIGLGSSLIGPLYGINGKQTSKLGRTLAYFGRSLVYIAGI